MKFICINNIEIKKKFIFFGKEEKIQCPLTKDKEYFGYIDLEHFDIAILLVFGDDRKWKAYNLDWFKPA